MVAQAVVGRKFLGSSRVADTCADDAIDAPEPGVGSPESAQGEGGRLEVLGSGSVDGRECGCSRGSAVGGVHGVSPALATRSVDARRHEGASQKKEDAASSRTDADRFVTGFHTTPESSLIACNSMIVRPVNLIAPKAGIAHENPAFGPPGREGQSPAK
jgi:hypothetical protein